MAMLQQVCAHPGSMSSIVYCYLPSEAADSAAQMGYQQDKFSGVGATSDNNSSSELTWIRLLMRDIASVVSWFAFGFVPSFILHFLNTVTCAQHLSHSLNYWLPPW